MQTVYTIWETPDLAKPFMNFLAKDELPTEEVAARQVRRRASTYTIINNELYKRSVGGLYKLCVSQEEGIKLLVDIHQGECGHHASSRVIAAKALRHGFYWPTTLKDAQELVKACNGCQ